MAVGLTTRGPNSFALNVPAGTPATEVVAKFAEVLPAYGWEVHDVTNNVFRSLNADDATYKYMRLAQYTDAVGVYVQTEVYHSWDAVSGTGAHKASHMLSGQQRDDYAKTAFYLTHNTHPVVIYSYVNARWWMLSSTVNNVGFGALAGEISHTIYVRWNDSNDYNYFTVKSGPHMGASGCVEIMCHKGGANQSSRYVWLHTSRMFEDRVAHFAGEGTILSSLDYWEKKEANDICVIPLLDVNGVQTSGVPLSFSSPVVSNIAELRKPAHPQLPTANIWSNKEVVYDIGVRAGTNPLGMLYGLKVAQSTGTTSPTSAFSDVKVGQFMLTDLKGTPVKHWHIPTYTKYNSYNQSKSCRYCTVYSYTNTWEYTPRVLIPA